MTKYMTRTSLAADVDPPPAVIPHLLNMIRNELRISGHTGLALLRSSRDGRWIVGIATSKRRMLVCKVGSADDLALSIEADISKLNLGGSTWRAAELAHDWICNDYRFLAFDWIEGEPLHELAKVYEICTDLAQLEIVHGDLAPWNILSRQESISVIDWETGDKRIAPGFDYIHFVLKQSMLSSRIAAHEALARVLADEHLHDLCRPHNITPHSSIASYLASPHEGDMSQQALKYRTTISTLLGSEGTGESKF